MKNNECIFTYDKISQIVDILYSLMDRCKVFTFEGSLGAGKTTVTRELLTKCGIDQPITSPTFTYVNVYKNNKGQTFYHFDLYRLNSLDEFIEAGFDEYLYQENSWAFIEWPEVIMPLLTKNVCKVRLDYIDDNRRSFFYEVK